MIYLRDYRPPSYWIKSVDLCFKLDRQATRVWSRLALQRRSFSDDSIRLDGEGLKPIFIRLNGRELSQNEYEIDAQGLTLFKPPKKFILETEVEIDPSQNKALSGLYLSHDLLCTQCEAEGFRRITWYLDRPDVMAPFKVRIEADRRNYPVLLSNGNPIGQGELPHGRHYVEWFDPFPKPSYLFALVAGRLAVQQDQFKTASGRTVQLRLYAEPESVSHGRYALYCLKKAMAWDEKAYGREYDLDHYHIVAVRHFNMGGMENKGLNLFDAQSVLADPETATDQDYLNIDAIVAHEYFHNWTGNRITCRDWFQLSLKEGLTVFREQQYCQDHYSPGVQRIRQVRFLKEYQFDEDASPLAHPVQPEAYATIDNFYTYTVYEKGAELIRMMYLISGAKSFRQAMDLYFERYDGQVVTIEDLIDCISEAAHLDLELFKRWYHQKGTPRVKVWDEYDPEQNKYRLHFKQDQNPPLHIPIQLALFGEKNRAPLFELKKEYDHLEFSFKKKPIPSFLGGFSAPIQLDYDFQTEQLLFLLRHDTDPFSRWQAGQLLIERIILASDQSNLSDLIAIWSDLLSESDQWWVAECLKPPSLNDLIKKGIQLESLYSAYAQFKQTVGKQLYTVFKKNYLHLNPPPEFSPQALAARQLKNTLLDYLVASQHKEAIQWCLHQYQSEHRTESLAALAIIAEWNLPQSQAILRDFIDHWRAHPDMLNRGLKIYAQSKWTDLNQLKSLQNQLGTDEPNRVRALLGTWSQKNLIQFHAPDGSGYAYLAEQIKQWDRRNPQLAAYLVRPFAQWPYYDPARQDKIKAQLKQLNTESLSKNTREMVEKCL